MNKWFKIFLGLAITTGSIYAWGVDLWGFGSAALSFLKGGVTWMLLFIGIILVLLGINDLKR